MYKFRKKKKTTIENVVIKCMVNLNGDRFVPLTDSAGNPSYLIYYQYNHNNPTRCLIYTPPDKILALGEKDNMWDWKKHEVLRELAQGVLPAEKLKFQANLGHMPLTLMDKQLLDDAVEQYLNKLREKI